MTETGIGCGYRPQRADLRAFLPGPVRVIEKAVRVVVAGPYIERKAARRCRAIRERDASADADLFKSRTAVVGAVGLALIFGSIVMLAVIVVIVVVILVTQVQLRIRSSGAPPPAPRHYDRLPHYTLNAGQRVAHIGAHQ